MTTRIKHLYIHVPFCRSICFYCDFCHRVYSEDLVRRWLDRLEKEIVENCHDPYETVYLGGGTPTCLSYEELRRLFEMLRPYLSEVKEFTVEVNPESLDEEKIELFQEYGVNRISMGIQSSDDEILRSLNRHHTFKDAVDRIDLLKRNGLTNISVDLMYSLPGQDLEILDQTLDDILSLDVPHISLYSLTVEENTVFGKKGIRPLDEDTEADMYELICRRLKENGYIHYEVSNFCKEGFESRHNLGYWKYEDFLGVSAGAAGKIGNIRYTNTSDLKRYLESEDIRSEEIELSKEDMMFEHIMMSLRTAEGLDLKAFNETYGIDFLDRYTNALRLHDKDIQIADNVLTVTRPAILNRILVDFLID